MDGLGPTVTEVTGTADGEERRQGWDPHCAYQLLVLWAAQDPAAAGGVLPIGNGSPGPWGVIGRGPGGASDPHPRLLPARHRPGRVDGGVPFEEPRLSRV